MDAGRCQTSDWREGSLKTADWVTAGVNALQTTDCRLQTRERRQETAGCRQQTAEHRIYAPGIKLALGANSMITTTRSLLQAETRHAKNGTQEVDIHFK